MTRLNPVQGREPSVPSFDDPNDVGSRVSISFPGYWGYLVTCIVGVRCGEAVLFPLWGGHDVDVPRIVYPRANRENVAFKCSRRVVVVFFVLSHFVTFLWPVQESRPAYGFARLVAGWGPEPPNCALVPSFLLVRVSFRILPRKLMWHLNLYTCKFCSPLRSYARANAHQPKTIFGEPCHSSDTYLLSSLGSCSSSSYPFRVSAHQAGPIPRRGEGAGAPISCYGITVTLLPWRVAHFLASA